jgi:hypothetical protein
VVGTGTPVVGTGTPVVGTGTSVDVTATGDSVLRGCRSGSCGRIRFPPLLGCSGRRVAVST